MIIKKTTLINDVKISNDIFTLKYKSQNILSGAYYLFNNWEDKTFTLKESLIALNELVKESNLWILIFNASWIDNNRIVRYKRIWGHISLRDIHLDNKFHFKDDFIINNKLIKLIGLIKCDDINDTFIVDILRKSSISAYLFISNEENAINLFNLFKIDIYNNSKKSFCSDSNARELSDSMVNLMLNGKIYMYFQIGWFDDRESGAILLGKYELLQPIFNILNNENLI